MNTQKLRHPLFVFSWFLLCGTALALLAALPANAVSSGTCQTVSIAVRLAPLLPQSETAVGDLCVPATWAEGEHSVDVLVHGASYNRSYWDWPTDQPNYSYVERTLQEGRATFAYDRLGAGDSSRPLSALATTTADAYILHQLVDWLGANDNDFAKVSVVGHSFGSIVAIEEAATYHDVDLLVVTGLLHAAGPAFTQTAQFLTLAATDPQFAGQGYDPGYLTTQPGVRGSFFYSVNADPAVIAYDEAHKDVIPSGQVPGLIQLVEPPLVNQSSYVTADVLIIDGQSDNLFCGLLLTCTTSNVAANETPYYSNAASLSFETVASTGHNLALHPSADASFATVNQWIEAH